MNKTLNLNTGLENITNIDNAYNPSFPYFLIIFFVYLLLLLVVSNLIAGLIRGYKRSLSYLRINIILSLNHALVEIFNTCVTFVVSRFGHFYFFQTHFKIIARIGIINEHLETDIKPFVQSSLRSHPLGITLYVLNLYIYSI